MKTLLTLVMALGLISSSAQALPVHSQKAFSAEELTKIFNTTDEYNYEGIVKLDNCSGSIIRFENSKDTDHALVLSNGHCVSTGPFGGFIPANEFVSHKPAQRTFRLLNKDGSLSSHSVTSTEIVYATMTGTDVSLYLLAQTYGEIKKKFNTEALTVESAHPADKEAIQILSGYWQKGYSCNIDGFVYKIKEDAYTWNDSIRYAKEGCHTIHGTSGSPILSANTHKVIGINNTGNDNGERCTMDNPCEVSTQGDIYVEQGRSYGQETYIFYSCLNSENQIDVTVSGCSLFHGGNQALTSR